MITNEGRLHIKRYMAGFVPSIGQSIAFGIGTAPESAEDTKLQFEVDRSDIVLTSYDFVNDRIVFKAGVADTFSGTIHEVALYSAAADAVAGEFASQLITTFDSATESWANPTTAVASNFTLGGGRIGIDSLHQAPAAGGSVTDALTELFLDMSGHSAADKFVFAFDVNNANVSSINFKFMTDASNFYQFNLGTQTVGYKIVEAAKSTAVVTGNPDWASINEVRVSTFSTAGGSASVDFDAIRIDDVDTVNPDYVMVARELLSAPFVKEDGKTKEIEFSVGVSVA